MHNITLCERYALISNYIICNGRSNLEQLIDFRQTVAHQFIISAAKLFFINYVTF